MDSEVQRDGRLMDIVDQAWREDELPNEDVHVDQMELPDIEPDNGEYLDTNITCRRQLCSQTPPTSKRSGYIREFPFRYRTKLAVNPHPLGEIP